MQSRIVLNVAVIFLLSFDPGIETILLSFGEKVPLWSGKVLMVIGIHVLLWMRVFDFFRFLYRSNRYNYFIFQLLCVHLLR